MTAIKKYSYLKEIEIKYRIKKVKDGVIGNKIIDPSMVIKLFSDLQNDSKEKIIAVNLDARNKILCFEIVAIGSVAAIYLRPMEVFRTSILVNASGIIVIHNHPSGDPKPSHDDRKLTDTLIRISNDLGLKFHDHIIIGIEKYYSFSSNYYYSINT